MKIRSKYLLAGALFVTLGMQAMEGEKADCEGVECQAKPRGHQGKWGKQVKHKEWRRKTAEEKKAEFEKLRSGETNK